MIRIIAGILLLLSIIFAYWWITWLLAIILLFYFPIYYEIIICGIIYDALYGISLPQFWNIDYVFTFFSIVLFVLSIIIKKYLIIYEF